MTDRTCETHKCICNICGKCLAPPKVLEVCKEKTK